jgi:hypothetical protein
MSFKFSEFPGIDQNHVTKLREAGIETTDDMMRVWGDEPKRAPIVEKSGLDMEQFTKLAGMARLARVKNVGTKHVAVLLASGIDGPKKLFEYTPDTLRKHLGETVAEKKLSYPVPTAVEVAEWYKDAKPVAGAV